MAAVALVARGAVQELDPEGLTMKTELARQLRGDEGERACVYPDSLGYSTIGVGRLVDSRKPGAGLRPDEITYLLNNDIDDRINALHTALPWFDNLDDVRKGVLLNLAFQLGTAGLAAVQADAGGHRRAAVRRSRVRPAAVQVGAANACARQASGRAATNRTLAIRLRRLKP
jgi:GH24 family phage-related lysozyme (muramidase)